MSHEAQSVGRAFARQFLFKKILITADFYTGQLPK